jgi:hypothetical protein
MAAPVEHAATTAHATKTAAPIVVDLGKKSRKQIRQARQGNGKLMDEMKGVLDELRGSGALAATAQPVLVIVRQKRRKSRMLWPMA